MITDFKDLLKHLDYASQCYNFKDYNDFIYSQSDDKQTKSRLIFQLAEIDYIDAYTNRLREENLRLQNKYIRNFVIKFFVLSTILIIMLTFFVKW